MDAIMASSNSLKVYFLSGWFGRRASNLNRLKAMSVCPRLAKELPRFMTYLLQRTHALFERFDHMPVVRACQVDVAAGQLYPEQVLEEEGRDVVSAVCQSYPAQRM
jgi:hypothetical protein